MSPDIPAPESAASSGGGDIDAPNGVCRAGAHRVEHLGCVDDELAFSTDALETCRSVGAPECDARCEGGDAPSCTALALVHELALEASPNTTYAARLLDKACAAGDGAGCNDLGVLHAKGLGFPVEIERAEILYGLACQHGSVVGCANLVTARTWGSDVVGEGSDQTTIPAGIAYAASVVERACTASHDARACAAVGVLRARGSVRERDEKLAATFFASACDAGDARACDELGRAYLRGGGVEADDVTALKLFRRACDEGRSDACTDLATMYCLGRGVPRDASRSASLFREACEAGDAAACRANACARPPI
jgi:TPR repeat protein